MTKTNNLPPALVELIGDPEAHRAEINVSGFARELLAEGMTLRAVTRGLAGTIVTLLDENRMKSYDEFLEAKHLLRELEQGFGKWWQEYEQIEDVADQIERSRAAGGTGNPYQ